VHKCVRTGQHWQKTTNMAAAHQSSITVAFVLAKANEIKDLLTSSEEANHNQAAKEADILWDLIIHHAHKDLTDLLAYDCLLLTDVRNTINRDHDAKYALYLIEGFIRYVSRRAATFSG